MATKTKDKTKKKTGQSLLGLAKKAKKKSSSKIPVVSREGIKNKVDELTESLQSEKILKGRIQSLKGEILPVFEEEIVKVSENNKGAVKSLRLEGENSSIVITRTSRYSPIDGDNKSEILEVIGKSVSDPEEFFENNFDEVFEISIDSNELNESIVGKIEKLLKKNPWLADILIVGNKIKPSNSFHDASVTDAKTRKVKKDLEMMRLLKPYSPSFKL